MKPVIKLDREEIRRAIERGDTCDGHYVLAVAPDGSQYRVYRDANNAPWSPWPAGWATIRIPALYSEGAGEDVELARDVLRTVLSPEDFAHAQERADSEGWVALARELAPKVLRLAEREQLDFLCEAFLAACNGDGSDLGDDAPWGYEHGEWGQVLGVVEPPAEFEWA